jgi:hypothetical protein
MNLQAYAPPAAGGRCSVISDLDMDDLTQAEG